MCRKLSRSLSQIVVSSLNRGVGLNDSLAMQDSQWTSQRCYVSGILPIQYWASEWNFQERILLYHSHSDRFPR